MKKFNLTRLRSRQYNTTGEKIAKRKKIFGNES